MKHVVCVTGANGFIGTHVVRVCLERGHAVHALVRGPHSAERVGHLRDLAGARDRLELFEGDVLDRAALGAALSGCDSAIHSAASVMLTARDPQADIVRPTVEGTRNMLDATLAAGARRFVLTSSLSAVIGYDKPEGHVFTSDDWATDATLENNPYGVAKRESERALWAFHAQHPELEAVSINPGLVLGPAYCKGHLSSSVSVVLDIVDRRYPGFPRLWHNCVDVDSVANAHVNCLDREGVVGQRFLMSREGMWWRDAASKLADRYQVRTGELPRLVIRVVAMVDPRASWQVLEPVLGRSFPVDAAGSQERLGVEYADAVEALRETAASLVAGGYAPRARVHASP